jgi:hypothetical protein
LRGPISITATKKEIKTKNIPPVRTYPSREPNMAMIIGARMEKDATPVGVVLRWQVSSDTQSSFSLFGSGLILRIFSLILHNFSYHEK